MSTDTATPTDRTATDTLRVQIITAIINARWPREAIPAIASNHDLTVAQVMTIAHSHGYPDKTTMRRRRAQLQERIDNPADPRPETPQTTRPEPYVAAVAAEQLFVDDTYQRPLDQARAEKMAADFQLPLLGIIEAAKRPDGRYAILDGQHRWAAYRSHHFTATPSAPPPHLACRIHESLTPVEEAALYHRLNTTRRQLTGWDRWVARRASGERLVQNIEEVVSRSGYRIDMREKAGVIRATRACENVVNLGGLDLLGNTLAVIRGAWDDDQTGLDASLIAAIGHILHHYEPGREVDVSRLVHALQSTMPRSLLARAAAVRELHRGTKDRLTAHVIVERYNTVSTAARLQPFFDRVKPLSKTTGTATRRNTAIRTWARRQGHEVGSAGKIPEKIRAAYAAAHPDNQPNPSSHDGDH